MTKLQFYKISHWDIESFFENPDNIAAIIACHG